MIGYSKLKGKVPDTILDLLPSLANKFEINTVLRLCHFLGQCSHESGGFKTTSENLLNLHSVYLSAAAGSSYHPQFPEPSIIEVLAFTMLTAVWYIAIDPCG